MAGDHKCPLCSATFTRPQHVGRHLRAHTGDRPYECKECPLRFARSDLLSRHVNKAHKPPDENGKAPVKKGRRKSMPTTTTKPPPPTSIKAITKNQPSTTAAKARRASFDVPPGPSNPQPPPLQAQSMYPHHPLLAGPPQPSDQSWSISNPSVGLNNVNQPHFDQNFSSGITGMLGSPYTGSAMTGMQPPFTAVPMRLSGSDQGIGTSPMARNGSFGSSGMGYDQGYKKRACDQCNHSKVRCDFAEPCHRCTHRNLRCTYNKPPKARTIATIPSQRVSLPMGATASGMSSSLSGSSASPQSHFSSPHSNPSPNTISMAPPSVHAGNPYSYQPQMSYIQRNPSQWSQNAQWNGGNIPMVDPSYGVLQQSPQAALFSSPLQPGQVNPLPPTQTSSNFSSLPLPLPHRNSASSGGSPQNLAPTPSLTSNSTSPPGTDEPSERRSSSISFHGAFPQVLHADTSSTGIDNSYAIQNKYSPTSVNHSVSVPTTGGMQPDFTNPFAWAPPGSATIDPRVQFRNSISSEDDHTTDHASRPSTASTFFDNLDEHAAHALNHRRRSSTGVWATAFNQMSLQDQTAPLHDPFSSGTAQQQFSARRPTFPMMTNISEDSDTTKVPSLSDVKDLWKLFMAEPMSGPVVSNNSTIYENTEMYHTIPAAPVPITPRPGMAPRGLSRSNSMPSLTSPPLAGPAFFSNFNGATPRPAQPQQSYNQAQIPTEIPPEDAVTMRKWKDSIQTRQQSFEFDPNVENKLKVGSPPNVHSTSPPAMPHAMSSHSVPILPPNAEMPPYNGLRPMASVLQHSSSLQQTLAPERTPSFGLDNLPTRNNFYLGGKPQSKLTSALARPGNKRLASQTLVPNDTGKKAVGDIWDEVEDEDENSATGKGMSGAGDFFGMPQSASGGMMTPSPLGAGGMMVPNSAAINGYYTTWPTPQATGGKAPMN